MICVRVEILRKSKNGHTRELARMDLENIADHAAAGDYEISASSKADPRSGRSAFEASGRIVTHRHKDSIWALVAKASAWVAASAEK